MSRPPTRVVAGCLAFFVVALSACATDASGGVDAVGAVEAAEVPTTTTPSGDVDAATPGGGGAAPAGGDGGAGASAGGSADPTDVEPPGVVAIVGDSLTVSAEDEIEAALTRMGVDDVVIDGLENRRMTIGGIQPGIDAIEDLVDYGLDPDVWVIALGTNDVGAQVRDADYRRAVVDVLAAIPGDAPVVWVDVWVRNLAERSAAANEVLRALARYRPRMTVVDWYSHGDDDGIIITDGVHLTNAGQQLFADEIAAAVEAVADTDA